MKKYLYIIRHANSLANKENIYQGQKIDFGLSKVGISQAKKVFNYFNKINIDSILLSESKRAIQTVKEIVADKKIKPSITSSLNEVALGKIEGKSKKDRYKIDYNTIIESWKKNDLNFSLKNSEKLVSIRKRVDDFLNIINESESKNILIVSHSRIIKFILVRILKKRIQDMDMFSHDNIYLYVILLHNNKYYLIESKSLK